MVRQRCRRLNKLLLNHKASRLQKVKRNLLQLSLPRPWTQTMNQSESDSYQLRYLTIVN